MKAPSSTLSASLLRGLAPWAAPLALLALWELAAQRGLLPRALLPAPSAVARAALEGALHGELLQHLAVSALCCERAVHPWRCAA